MSLQVNSGDTVATIEQTKGEGLEDLAVDKDTFETQITEAGKYDFVARLNREHIIATVSETSVRMDRDESHDVEGAVAWTPDGETYFYTEELELVGYSLKEILNKEKIMNLKMLVLKILQIVLKKVKINTKYYIPQLTTNLSQVHMLQRLHMRLIHK